MLNHPMVEIQTTTHPDGSMMITTKDGQILRYWKDGSWEVLTYKPRDILHEFLCNKLLDK